MNRSSIIAGVVAAVAVVAVGTGVLVRANRSDDGGWFVYAPNGEAAVPDREPGTDQVVDAAAPSVTAADDERVTRLPPVTNAAPPVDDERATDDTINTAPPADAPVTSEGENLSDQVDVVMPQPESPPVLEYASDQSCPESGQSAVVDRDNQRAWLCRDGVVADEMVMSSAWSQPDPGRYEVYAKDMNSSSNFGGHYSTMTHFVAFSYGKNTGARIAFHSVPQLPDGTWVQTRESVGTQDLRGDSAGCIRMLPEDAELIWSWLDIGDDVVVIS